MVARVPSRPGRALRRHHQSGRPVPAGIHRPSARAMDAGASPHMVRAPSPLRLAVFTSTYPARVATFFGRDIGALLEAGVAIDVFAVAPLDPRLWRYRLDILGEDILPRHRVHHLRFLESLAHARPWPMRKVAAFVRDAAAVSLAVAAIGPGPRAQR